jgi:hypothetical protein
MANEMPWALDPFRFLLIATACGMNQRHLQMIDYLGEENRVLREQLGGGRLRLNDDQRRRLAAKAKGLPDPKIFAATDTYKEVLPSELTINTVQWEADHVPQIRAKLLAKIEQYRPHGKISASLQRQDSLYMHAKEAAMHKPSLGGSVASAGN